MVIGVLPSLLVVVGGNFLRRTIVEAGHVSSQDARTTLWNAKPSVHAPFEKDTGYEWRYSRHSSVGAGSIRA